MNSHNALIPLTEGEIRGYSQPLCNARDLHAFLEVGKDFSNWVKDRIEQHGFVEGQDFMVFANFGENPQGGRPAKEYHLTVEAAKHIAMAEHTPRGKEARDWFIECERIAFDKRNGQAEFAIDTGPVGLYLSPDAEDYLIHAIHAGGLVENSTRLTPDERRAVLFGTEQDLLDIRQNRKAPPRFTGLMPLPSWIEMNHRHAMYGHAIELCGGDVISPWIWGDPFAADSIMFVRDSHRSSDFSSMTSTYGYSIHTLLSKP